jgi:HD superfamily phosphohydrolase
MSKIIRDPLHDLIRVECKHALRLIDSEPMQRLRKIRQLGLAWLVFPGAEHSRFVHSLGVFHLANQAMGYLNRIKRPGSDDPFFDKYQQTAIGLAALAHDFGHGPFSHVFERVARDALGPAAGTHVQWTIKILQEHPQVSKIMQDAGSGVANTVREILSGTHKLHYMNDIISSQLDVDRFDYLLRDSLMTGAQYGNFDLAWMFRTLKIGPLSVDEEPVKQVLAVDGRRGLSALEAYILGRHYMYKNVYYHKTIRAAESMLRAIFERVVTITRDEKIPSPHPIITAFAEKRRPNLEEYLSLNDFHVLSWIEDWAKNCDDRTLSDLSRRLHTRKLFGAIPIAELSGKEYADARGQAKKFLQDRDLDPQYYLLEDEAKDVAYKDYFYHLRRGESSQDIYLLSPQRETHPLSAYDGLIMQAKSALKITEVRWNVPKEYLEDIKALLPNKN